MLKELGGGAVFVYPTETVYGIGGVCTIHSVKDRILHAKERDACLPMILIAPSRSFFSKLPLEFPPAAETLVGEFWPGVLTLVLPASAGGDDIAIRVSMHPCIEALFTHLEAPLYSTSANMSGKEYVNDPDVIFSFFSGSVDFMIDAGPLPPSLPSTVVKVGRDDAVAVLREGAIEAARIFDALSYAKSNKVTQNDKSNPPPAAPYH